ncbi:MAG: S1 RNA-binding domain-containing protein, partial [Candidatus Tagabacteria bacterium]
MSEERINNNIQVAERPSSSMDFFLKTFSLNSPKAGNLIEGKVIEQKGSSLFVDLAPYGTGIIYGREFNNARETIRSLRPDDIITAKIVETENENGYIELSLREAGKDMVWREAEELEKKRANLVLAVTDANKGGLIMDWKGIQGFLPASQLRLKHYPRVEGGDKEKILDELKKMVGAELTVTIIALDPIERKLIFSEKGTEAGELKEIVAKYKVGDILECEVTGVVDFGVFVKVEEGLEGLVHISELDWSLVENPADFYKVGDKATAQIIEIKDGKISLSIKALKQNPWTGVQEKYKKGDIIKGVVIKFNKHGALISIEEGVAGLAHVSEFGSEKKMKEKLELGKSYLFQIVLFEPQDHRLILTFLDEKTPTATP